ncbi:MAG: thioredoxin family protein [Acidimicrobiia bacterium]|nr:thioredoxin family protein [Acidimicrobiia bacterium]
MKRLLLLVGLLAVLVTSCGGGGQPLIGIRASSDTAVGDPRFLFAVNELDGTRRGGPDEHVHVTATKLDDPSRVIDADASFVWIVPDVTGLYRVDLPFDAAGRWQIDFTISTGESTDPFLLDVQAEPATVAIGEAAPMVATASTAATPIGDLTTDDDPDPDLYTASLDELLHNGRPTVALFATPAFCVSAACGPLLDQMKTLAADHPDTDFVHVEVYQGFNEPGFKPDRDHLVPAVVAFGLPSEPWMFVMDGDGTVVARFEGVLGEGELDAVLEGL